MIKGYLKFLAISIVIGVALSTIIGTVLAYTSINDNMMGTLVFIGVAISVFIGSTLLNRKFKKKGFLYGGVFGLTYFCMIYLFATVFFTGFTFNTTVLIYLAMSVVAGTIGGIIGVNI